MAAAMLRAAMRKLAIFEILFVALLVAGCGSDHRTAQENVPIRSGPEDDQPSAEATDQGGGEPEHPAEPPPEQPQQPQEPSAGNMAQLPPDSPLLHPERATERAPDTFAVKLETTKGDIIIDVTRAWSPNGADRFYNLVRVGYFDDTAFFRVISGFMAQIGIHSNAQVNTAWRERGIQDDPVTQSNTRGMVTFAQTSAPNSRTTQFFINFGDNSQLDGMRFAPFGRVRDMAVVDRIYSGYGEGAPQGRGPSQGRIQRDGNTYLRAEFPELDYIRRATLM